MCKRDLNLAYYVRSKGCRVVIKMTRVHQFLMLVGLWTSPNPAEF